MYNNNKFFFIYSSLLLSKQVSVQFFGDAVVDVAKNSKQTFIPWAGVITSSFIVSATALFLRIIQSIGLRVMRFSKKEVQCCIQLKQSEGVTF